MRKKWLVSALAAALALLLCACDAPRLSFGAEDLYALPELPVRYASLNSRLSDILEGGAEYAAPLSGGNLQPVQVTDLDGDGREEALAFFRRADDEKPLKIYVFTAQGEDFVQSGLIEGSGTAVYSVSYEDMNGDGAMEIIVGWRVSGELQALTLYTCRGGEIEERLRTNYLRYVRCDLDGDGVQELVTFRSDELGGCIAACYDFTRGEAELSSETALNASASELAQGGKITAGTLRDGAKALFVTAVRGGDRAVRDLLILRRGALTDPLFGAEEDALAEIGTLRLTATDVDGDGVTELPRPVWYREDEEAEPTCRFVEWQRFDSAGRPDRACATYHAAEDGWYLILPDAWLEGMETERTQSAEEASVTFFVREGEQRIPLLRVSLLSGTNRERALARTGRFALARTGSAIYAAELLQGTERTRYALTEEEVRTAFTLIVREWTVGEN